LKSPRLAIISHQTPSLLFTGFELTALRQVAGPLQFYSREIVSGISDLSEVYTTEGFGDGYHYTDRTIFYFISEIIGKLLARNRKFCM
jgi:hypothetical protein